MFKEIKKGDVLLLAAFLVAALLIALSPSLHNTLSSHRNHREDAVLEIRIAGNLYGAYSLSEEQTIEIQSDYGNNTLTISGGTAAMTASDCKNQICVRSGAISEPGQMIVCLPHRLSVEILQPTGEAPDSDPSYDAIVR